MPEQNAKRDAEKTEQEPWVPVKDKEVSSAFDKITKRRDVADPKRQRTDKK
jgi:hypothetical protein